MNKAVDVARQLIFMANKKDISITNLQLHNLLFFIQFLYLGLCDTLAFKDDIIAGINGAWIRNVYYHYKGWIAEDIISRDNQNIIPDETLINIIDGVIDKFGKLDWNRLKNEICSDRVWERNRWCNEQIVIPIDEIKDFAKRKGIKTII